MRHCNRLLYIFMVTFFLFVAQSLWAVSVYPAPTTLSFNYQFSGQTTTFLVFQQKTEGGYQETSSIALATSATPKEFARCLLTTNESNKNLGITFSWHSLAHANAQTTIRYTMEFGIDSIYLASNKFDGSLPPESKKFSRNIEVPHGNLTRTFEVCTMKISMLENDIAAAVPGAYSDTIYVNIIEGGVQ